MSVPFHCPRCYQPYDVRSLPSGTHVVCPYCAFPTIVSHQGYPPMSAPMPLPGQYVAPRVEVTPRVRRSPKIDRAAPIDEVAVSQTAKRATAALTLLAYAGFASTILVGVVAAMTLAAGGADHLALAAYFIICMAVGIGLFLHYVSIRGRAYSDALATERSRAGEQYLKQGSVAGTIFMILPAIHGAYLGIRFGAADGHLSGAFVLALLAIGAIAVAGFVFALMWRAIGFFRTLSLAHITGSLLCCLVGLAVTSHAQLEAKDQAKLKALADAEAAEKGAQRAELYKQADRIHADGAVLSRCIATQNLPTVRDCIDRHGRDKIVFLEIDCTLVTADQRRRLSDQVMSGGIPGYVGLNVSDTQRAIEVVCAPIDDLQKLAAGITAFQVVGKDPAQQRIKLAPHPHSLETATGRATNQREFDELSRLGSGAAETLRARPGDDHREPVVVVKVLHPTKGIGVNPTTVYRRIKSHAKVRSIGRQSDGSQVYVVEYDETEQLAAKLECGVVIALDGFDRTITVDLDFTKAKPFPLKPARTLGDSIVPDGRRFELDLTELRNIFGDSKVLQVSVSGMSRDPAEQDFFRRRLRVGTQVCRVYYTADDKGTDLERYLIVPAKGNIDSFRWPPYNFMLEISSSDAQRRELELDIPRLRRAMQAAAGQATDK